MGLKVNELISELEKYDKNKPMSQSVALKNTSGTWRNSSERAVAKHWQSETFPPCV